MGMVPDLEASGLHTIINTNQILAPFPGIGCGLAPFRCNLVYRLSTHTQHSSQPSGDARDPISGGSGAMSMDSAGGDAAEVAHRQAVVELQEAQRKAEQAQRKAEVHKTWAEVQALRSEAQRVQMRAAQLAFERGQRHLEAQAQAWRWAGRELRVLQAAARQQTRAAARVQRVAREQQHLALLQMQAWVGAQNRWLVLFSLMLAVLRLLLARQRAQAALWGRH